jgi:hypothetical protein
VRHGLGLHPFGRATLTAMALSTVCFAAPQVVLHMVVHLVHPGLPLTIAVSVIGAAGYLFAIFGLPNLRSMFTQGGR